jgi:hypothetical protein
MQERRRANLKQPSALSAPIFFHCFVGIRLAEPDAISSRIRSTEAMKTVSNRSPDGRVIQVKQGETGKRRRLDEARSKQFLPFLAACEATLPDLALEGPERLAFFIFLLGAADRLWARQRLEDRDFPDFAAELLTRSGVDLATARTISTTLPQLREIAVAREMMTEGARAMDMWVDGTSGNTLLQLPVLLRRWQTPDLPWR